MPVNPLGAIAFWVLVCIFVTGQGSNSALRVTVRLFKMSHRTLFSEVTYAFYGLTSPSLRKIKIFWSFPHGDRSLI